MATQTEQLIYAIFHMIRCLLNLNIFTGALLLLLGGCCHNELRSSKRQWFIFNMCISMMIFAIINSVFSMIPFAPTYLTSLAVRVCTLQHFLEDVAQAQVAYSFVAFAVHQIGPQEWRDRSFLWFGFCVGIQWSCSYLLPLPQILMSNVYICFAYFPNQFFVIYSVVFLLALPLFLHLLVYIIANIFQIGERTTTQVYPMEHTGPIQTNYQSMMKYLLIMSLLFDLIGYGPRGILGAIDYKLRQSIIIYAALEILPSVCLLINIGLLYKINKEARKKITSVCRC